MRFSSSFFVCFPTLWAAVTAQADTPEPTLFPVEPGEIMTLQSGIYNRSYWIYAPDALKDQDAVPLVFGFHGLGGWETLFADQALLANAADEYGFIVVAGLGVTDETPAGPLNAWNAGTCCFGVFSGGELPEGFELPDDVQYARDVVAQIESSGNYAHSVGLKFATGFSNGAMLAHRLACEATDLFHGFGPHSGYPQVGGDFPECTPESPRYMLHAHGTADATVRFNATTLFIGFNATVEFWQERNGCDESVEEITFSTEDTTCTRYTDCDAEAIEFCVIKNLTHTWSRPGDRDEFDGTQPDTYLDFTPFMFEAFQRVVDTEREEQCPYECHYRFEGPKVPSLSLPAEGEGDKVLNDGNPITSADGQTANGCNAWKTEYLDASGQWLSTYNDNNGYARNLSNVVYASGKADLHARTMQDWMSPALEDTLRDKLIRTKLTCEGVYGCILYTVEGHHPCQVFHPY